jgi:hypothetical protein
VIADDSVFIRGARDGCTRSNSPVPESGIHSMGVAFNERTVRA